MNAMWLIGLAVGGVMGALVAVLVMRRKNLEVAFELQQARRETENHQTMVGELEAAKLKVAGLTVQLTEQQKNQAAERLQMQDSFLQQKAALQQQWNLQVVALRDEFKVMADKMLQEQSGAFYRLGSENMDKTLQPLSIKIEEFKESVQRMTIENIEGRAKLGAEIDNLLKTNQSMNETAANLTKALTTSTKVQGDFGEMILQKMLEDAGLKEGETFSTQLNVKEMEGGRNYRPDVVIHLPDARELIVDSKVSLTDYNAYCAAQTETEKNQYQKNHLSSVWRHVQELSDKNYQGVVPDTLDFVLMFMPIEGAYDLAVQAKATLFEEAYRKKVMMVTPATLYAVLHIVISLWNRDKIDKNVQNVIRQATSLYDKFSGFVAVFEKMGLQMKTMQKTYDEATGRLSVGRGNLMSQFEQFKEYGVKPK